MFFSERQSWANVTWLIAAGDFTARSQWMSTRHGCLAGGSDQHGQFPASNVPHGRRVWRRTDPKNLRHTRSQRLRDQNEVQSNPGSFPARRHGQSPETFSFEFSIQLIVFFWPFRWLTNVSSTPTTSFSRKITKWSSGLLSPFKRECRSTQATPTPSMVI